MSDYQNENLPQTVDEWAPPEPAGDIPYIPGEAPDIDDPFANGDEALAKAEIKEDGEFTNLPNGKYQGFVASVKAFTIAKGKRAGYAGINLQIKVIVGEHKKESQSYMRSFHSKDKDSMDWLKKDLARLGVLAVMEEQGISLRDACTTRLDIFLDRVVEFQVKHTASDNPERPFVNTYINRLLGIPIPPDMWDGSEGTPQAPQGGGTRF